jgi:uncharacterized repeat protein (TIGR04076 family)
MNESRDVVMRVVSIAGACPNGHSVGQEFVIKDKTAAGICLGSFSTCLPYLIALRYGASFPWEARKGTITIGCPDAENQVVWRLERCCSARAAD